MKRTTHKVGECAQTGWALAGAGVRRKNLKRFRRAAWIVLALRLIACESEGPAPDPQGRILVRYGEAKGEISPLLYGHFIEVLDGAVYGGVWQDEPKTEVLGGGIRKDVVDLTRAACPGVIRWPGGLYADGYHWEDGIGPRADRPRRPNVYWNRVSAVYPELGPEVSNGFGSTEFADFTRLTGSQAYINVNWGSGTPQEAGRWVEYMNGDPGTSMGALRASHGFEAPFGVPFWGIGNEIWGVAIGATDPETYAKSYRTFAQAMRAADPNVHLVLTGAEPEYPGWNETVVAIAGESADFLAVHVYVPGPLAFARDTDTDAGYRVMLSGHRTVESALRGARAQIEAVLGKGARLPIALDEWGAWWHFEGLASDRPYSLKDALFAAGVLHVLHRMHNEVGMANWAQLTNVLPLIMTREDDALVTPIHAVFRMYACEALPVYVPVNVEGPAFDAPAMGNVTADPAVPTIDASATLALDGSRMSLFVINRDPESDLTLDVDLGGFPFSRTVRLTTLNGPSPFSRNTWEEKDLVALERQSVRLRGGQVWRYTFAAHSVSRMDFRRS